MAKVTIDKEEEEEVITFGSIVTGAIFLWHDRVYLKVESINEEDAGAPNATYLPSGDLTYFYDSEEVKVPKSAEIKISI